MTDRVDEKEINASNTLRRPREVPEKIGILFENGYGSSFFRLLYSLVRSYQLVSFVDLENLNENLVIMFFM